MNELKRIHGNKNDILMGKRRRQEHEITAARWAEGAPELNMWLNHWVNETKPSYQMFPIIPRVCGTVSEEVSLAQ